MKTFFTFEDFKNPAPEFMDEIFTKEKGYYVDDFGYLSRKLDRIIDLKEGDRVEAGNGVCIVDWKLYDIDDESIRYSLKYE